MKKSQISLTTALLPLFFLVVLLSYNVIVYGDDALNGSNQFILLIGGAIAAIIGFKKGISYDSMLEKIADNLKSVTGALLILLFVGALSGTWLISGIIPAMIYYGLQILHPSIFLPACIVICAIISISTGSSWTTSATVGIALIGIGSVLKIPLGMVAGAIISGAYFGDKISPLSDTTNLAPAMAGTDLFTHIKYMAYTTIPSITITLIIFLAIGLNFEGQIETTQTDLILNAITEKFQINGWLFLVPIIVIFLIVKKVNALPSLLSGALLGGIFALIFQPTMVAEIGGGTNARAMYMGIMKALYGSMSIETSNEMVTELLHSKGMSGMLGTIWLILSAMVFGGVMEKAGFLKKIAEALLTLVSSTGSLVASTVGTCAFFNITASDQYLAIVIPGKMYANTYKNKGLAPENLSRTLEDSGTVTSVLVPWNTCGAYHANVLSVATLTYLPFCFFNIISPFMSIFFAYANIKLRKSIHSD